MLPQPTLTADALPAVRASAAARLDRLPIGSVHRQIMWLLGLTFFFELGDINTFAFAAPAIQKAWNLSIETIGIVTSATFFGMFIGATTGGWLSDRIGRKRALLLTTAWYSGFSLLNAFVWDVRSLFATRMLTGVGLSAMTVVGMTYVSEMFPAARRGSYQGWVMVIGLTGIPTTAYVARFAIPAVDWGWRVVFVWGSLGFLLLLFAHRLYESPRWFENHGRLAEADDVLDRIEAKARREFGELPPARPVASVVRRGGYRHLLSAAYRWRTVTFIAVWTLNTLGFYAFTAWVPTLLVAHGFSLVRSLAWSSAMSIGAVPGAMLTALVSDRAERKWLISLTAIVIATCGLIYGMTFTTATIIVFGFAVAMFLQTWAALLYAYTPECFPTEVRNSAAGLVYGIGRLANVFGPLIVAYIYTHYGYTSVFVYIAAVWLVLSATVALFGPTTRARALT